MDKKIVISRMKRSSFFLIGLSITVLIICAAIFGPMLVKSDPVHNDLMSKLLPPLTDGHLLGTDQLGRDILARILYGARMSLIISFVVTILAVALGTLLGLISGYWGGIVDTVIMRICDVFLSLPLIVVTIALVAV